MALSTNEIKFIEQEVYIARKARELMFLIMDLKADYYNLYSAKLTNGNIVERFPDLTLAKVQSGISTLEGLLTYLGDDASGQATNLIKMKG